MGSYLDNLVILCYSNGQDQLPPAPSPPLLLLQNLEVDCCRTLHPRDPGVGRLLDDHGSCGQNGRLYLSLWRDKSADLHEDLGSLIISK